MALKRVSMSFAASLTYRPEDPERTASMSRPGIGGDVVFQTWPSRIAMARSVRMQQKREPKSGDWRPRVKLTDTEGY